MSSKGIFNSLNTLLDKFFHSVNTNKYLFGILMLVMNLGSKYLISDLSAPFHKALFSSKLARRFIIFCIIFIATRDIKVAFILTAAFIIIFLNLFDDRSDYCILPKSYRNLDTNLDGEITPDEIYRAYNILKKTGRLPKDVSNSSKKNESEIHKNNNVNPSFVPDIQL
jgi:hypothetical protein